MYNSTDNLEKLSLDEFMKLTDKSRIYREYLALVKDIAAKRETDIKYAEEELMVYDEIIDMIADYLRKNTIYKNPLSYCGALSELVFKEGIFGRFSNNENSYEEDISGVLGSTIVNGKGCCRHLASFYSDILNRVGINSQYMYTRTISGGEDNSMIFEHVFNVPVLSSSMYFENDDSTLESNHAVVMFNYENRVFVYDPLNFLLFNVSGIEAKSLHGNYKMYICPYSYIMLYGEAIQTAQNEVKYLLSFNDIYDDYIETEYLKLVNIAAEKFNFKNHDELRESLEEPIERFRYERILRLNGGNYIRRLNR